MVVLSLIKNSVIRNPLRSHAEQGRRGSLPGSCNFCTHLFQRQVSVAGLGWPWKAWKALTLRLGEVTEMPSASLEEPGPAQLPQGSERRGLCSRNRGESPARRDLQCPHQLRSESPAGVAMPGHAEEKGSPRVGGGGGDLWTEDPPSH